MAGEGRESKKDNDLFYTCSLIDYIARKTKNTRADVVNKLGKQRLDKIYDLADVIIVTTLTESVLILSKKQEYKKEILTMWVIVNTAFHHIGTLEKYISG